MFSSTSRNIDPLVDCSNGIDIIVFIVTVLVNVVYLDFWSYSKGVRVKSGDLINVS